MVVMVIKQTNKSRIALPVCHSGESGCFGRNQRPRVHRKSSEKSVYRLSYFNTLTTSTSKRRNAIRFKNRPIPYQCFRWVDRQFGYSLM